MDNVIAHTGETLALFQNMDNERYRNVVFGNDDIRSIFGKYRILVRKGTVTLTNDSVNSDSYSEKMFNKRSEIYKNNRNNG